MSWLTSQKFRFSNSDLLLWYPMDSYPSYGITIDVPLITPDSARFVPVMVKYFFILWTVSSSTWHYNRQIISMMGLSQGNFKILTLELRWIDIDMPNDALFTRICVTKWECSSTNKGVRFRTRSSLWRRKHSKWLGSILNYKQLVTVTDEEGLLNRCKCSIWTSFLIFW